MIAYVASRMRNTRHLDPTTSQVARNSSWSIATTALTVGLFFIETIVLARYLGTTGFGVYILVIAYPEAVQLFLDFRTREAMTRFLGGFLARGERDHAVAIVKFLWLVDLCVVSAAFVFVVLTAPLVAPHLTDDPNGVHLMRVYAIAMFLGGLDATAGSVVRVFERFGVQFAIAATTSIPRLLLIVVLAAADAGVEGIVWGRVAAEAWTTAVALTVAAVLLGRALWDRRAAPLAMLHGRRREVFGFLGHMNIQGSARAAASKLDVLVVGALAGASTASIYKIGVQFGSSPRLFADPLFVAAYPTFTRLHATGLSDTVRSVGRKMSVMLAVLVVPTALVLAAVSEPLLGWLVGADFSEAWLPMTIVLLGVSPTVIFFWGRAAMLAMGDARIATTITGRALLVQFALLLPLVVWLGAAGGALALAAMNLTAVALSLRYLRSKGLL